MNDLFPDYKSFQEFVKNCEKKVLQLRKYPYDDCINEDDRLKNLKKVQLCQNFQLGGVDDGVDEELKENITLTLRQGKLLPILSVGVSGMNEEYIEFMMKLRNMYNSAVDAEWDGEPGSYRQTCSNIATTWRQVNFKLDI
jgi:hypothetical protein